MKTKVKSKAMFARTWNVLSMAVEDGVGYGYNRAHKHTSTPDEELVREQIYDAVMNSISEWFSFGDEDEEEELDKEALL